MHDRITQSVLSISFLYAEPAVLHAPLTEPKGTTADAGETRYFKAPKITESDKARRVSNGRRSMRKTSRPLTGGPTGLLMMTTGNAVGGRKKTTTNNIGF